MISRSEPFTQPAPNPSTPVIPRAIISEQVGWAKTLIVGVDSHPPAPDQGNGLAVGNVVFQLAGTMRCGQRTRRFALQRWMSIEIDITAFDGLRLQILGSNIPGADVFGVIHDQQLGGQAGRPVATLATNTTAGVFAVPWGARQLFSATLDPAFAWLAYDAAGTVVNFPDPIVVGDTRDVKGVLYQSAVALSALWEIQL